MISVTGSEAITPKARLRTNFGCCGMSSLQLAQTSTQPLSQGHQAWAQGDRLALILTSLALNLLRLIVAAIVAMAVIVVIEVVFASFTAAADHNQINLLAIVVHALDLHFDPIA